MADLRVDQLAGAYPPSLEYFRHVDQLIIRQVKELVESWSTEASHFQVECLQMFVHSVITGFETQNRYRVFNSMGQQVFFIQEGKWKVYTKVKSCVLIQNDRCFLL